MTVLRMIMPASAMTPRSAMKPNGASNASSEKLAPMRPSGAVENTRNSVEKLLQLQHQERQHGQEHERERS